MKPIISLLALFLLFSCNSEQYADLIITNSKTYTVDESFSQAEAFAVRDGKFIAIGTDDEILATYTSEQIVDANGQAIVPGFIDAHCHFLGLGVNQQAVDLVGTTSFEEVVQRVVDFQKKNQLSHITGRGWDQNDWEDKRFPKKTLLDSLFPDTPISLTRIDGHAIICNQAALDLGGVTADSKTDGGEVVVEDGELTGVLIDNAENLVMNYWPGMSATDVTNALKKAEEICFEYGLTTVDDAGLGPNEINLIESLQAKGELKMRVYAMVSASKENLDYYLERDPLKTERLNVGSFKFYADGALGSRGAMLRAPYSDKPGHLGLMVNSLETLNETAERIAKSDYQMNTHAIGDSANHAVLATYKRVLDGQQDRRWRIEHAQVISPEDFDHFNNIVPSVQPTHATSDMYWAEDRLGPERVKGAYAFKQLLESYGQLALGTDFPVEQVNPFYTFYAAVARQDLEQFPEDGYQMENALSREETLKGMTIWAAHSNFEEDEKGSIEPGKFADFIMLDRDIMTAPLNDIPDAKVDATYLGGELVMQRKK
ncbi:MAG: amidohydrolase [Flavobacteriaceae bacterium]|nr:amidohydrolase [Flavobacteriaceae bacterium]